MCPKRMFGVCGDRCGLVLELLEVRAAAADPWGGPKDIAGYTKKSDVSRHIKIICIWAQQNQTHLECED